ncbi:MAG TPA: FIST N-terminal domain-containing protein [Egibacteraceae bacterium]|nr:FIST N-terminal domain-containing protein [Egibacteraceae bacterium]
MTAKITRVRAGQASAVGPDPDAAAADAAGRVREALEGRAPDLAVVFIGAAYAPAAEAVRDRIADTLAPAHLIGTTSGAGVIAAGREIEDVAGLSLWGACLPGAELTPLRYEPPRERAGEGPDDELGWQPPPEQAKALLLLADPFSFPADGFLAWIDQARPGLPVSGGLASVGASGRNRLLLDDAVHTGGAVAVAVGGDVHLRTLVSQGCRPIGGTYVVTRADRNLLQELGGQPPIERIQEVFAEADPSERELIRGGLHIGTVIDEYRDEFGRGDFLVRGVLGADPGSGAIAVGDVVRVGQTVRFHVRDAASADEDLRELLDDFARSGPADAALLFSCNGRGTRLFGRPDHDASLVRHSLGDLPLAGFFCAGEFGPVGPRSFLHGFTASILAFAS